METEDPKDTAYYAALVDAWMATRMEKDRTLLALSAGGVGLLVTLLTTSGVQSCLHMFLYMAALASFLVAIGSCIWIFQRNSHYLEKEISAHREKRPPSDDCRLIRLDRTLIWAFIVGVVLSIAVAIISAWPSEGGSQVSEKITSINIPIPSGDKYNYSLGGVGKVRPGASTGQGGANKTSSTGGAEQGSGADSKPADTIPPAADKSE